MPGHGRIYTPAFFAFLISLVNAKLLKQGAPQLGAPTVEATRLRDADVIIRRNSRSRPVPTGLSSALPNISLIQPSLIPRPRCSARHLPSQLNRARPKAAWELRDRPGRTPTKVGASPAKRTAAT
jgi:hypothetical protein